MSKKYFYKEEQDVPIYRGRLVVIISNDKDKLKSFIPYFEDNEIYAHSFMLDWKGKEGFVIALNFNNKHRPIHIGTIAHEAVHVAHLIAEHRGVIPDFVNDEPIAYLVEWIVDEVIKLMEKHNF